MTVDSTAISRPRPPDLIPGYQLDRLVGKGGMGEVYKGIQLSLGRAVAVKLLAADLATDQAFVTRFEKEAAALAALSHPHIVSIVDKGKHKDTYYLVMEFVDGPSLREMMRSPLLDAPSALKIGLDICKAIDYAHGRGVIHRDLKPENILFDEQAGGIPKVTDFGLASFLQKDSPAKFNVTETHVSMGTLAYMAPEQRVDAKTADHRADIYTLGVILYELLVGEVPVGNFFPPSQKKPELDKRLDPIIAKCLRPDPQDRYQSLRELLTDLEPLVPVTHSQRPRAVGPIERAKLAAQRAVRRALRIAGTGLVVIAALVLIGASLRMRGSKSVPVATSDAMAADLGATSAITVGGRISDEAVLKSVIIGEGPDKVPVVAFGRGIGAEGSAIAFQSTGQKSEVGRASLDLATVADGTNLMWTAEATTQVGSTGATALLKRVVMGAQPEPRSGLVLNGEPGRWAAVVMSGVGEPIELEWALGERRGKMLGPLSPKNGTTRLEINVDKKGELRAYVGDGKDQRLVGEPVSLGAGWQKFFGKVPGPTLVCLEGGCEFRRIAYEVAREPPPPPPPPPAPPPEVKPQPAPPRAKKPPPRVQFFPKKGKR